MLEIQNRETNVAAAIKNRRVRPVTGEVVQLLAKDVFIQDQIVVVVVDAQIVIQQRNSVAGP